MITRTVRLQLLAFLIVTVLGVSYVGVRYAGLDRLFGATTYPVQMQLTESGGIFTGADVTYRGVSVGRVGPLALTADGVQVQLDIAKDAPPIPADLDARVSNLSAIGEQFVDLLPARADGPTLEAGSVIPASRTTTPVPVEDLILSVDELARSVPLDSLRTVVDELGTAFVGTGPELQTLLDSSDVLTAEAVDALPETLTLIRDGRTVLATQNEQAGAITSFSSDLRLLAAQLAASDPDIRRLLRTGPQVSAQTIALLRESGPQLGELIADLLTTSRVIQPRQAALRQIFVTYPILLTGADTVLPGDGTAHLGLVTNMFDPYVCVRGYEDTLRRDGSELGPSPLNTEAFCAEPPGSPTNVRGAANVPRPGVQPDEPREPAAGTAPTTAAPGRPPLPGAAGFPSAPLTSSPVQVLQR